MKIKFEKKDIREILNINYNDIFALENKLKVKIPLDYTTFLVENNGGHTKGQYVFFAHNPYNKKHEEICFWEINGVFEIENYKANHTLNFPHNLNISSETEYFQVEYEKDKGQIVIASDIEGRGKILLCVRGKNYGKIYYWHPELFDQIEINSEEVYLCVANSFTEFINNLTYKDLE